MTLLPSMGVSLVSVYEVIALDVIGFGGPDIKYQIREISCSGLPVCYQDMTPSPSLLSGSTVQIPKWGIKKSRYTWIWRHPPWCRRAWRSKGDVPPHCRGSKVKGSQQSPDKYSLRKNWGKAVPPKLNEFCEKLRGRSKAVWKISRNSSNFGGRIFLTRTIPKCKKGDNIYPECEAASTRVIK